MAPSDIRIVFSDMDDTFLAPDKSIPPENLAAVDRLLENGIAFVPCTGRHLGGIPEAVLSRSSLAVSDSGASVTDLRSGNLVWSRPVNPDTVLAMHRELQDVSGVEFDLYIDGKVRVQRDSMWVTDEADLAPAVKEYLSGCRTPFDEPFEQFAKSTSRINRLSVQVLTDDLMARALPVMRRHEDVALTPVLGNVVEVTAQEASKGNAIQAVCDLLGINPSCAAVFGDSPNDISMFKAAGTAVAVGNANEECKALSDLIAPACEDAGFARGIEMLGLI